VENWRGGEVESWRGGELERWRVGEVESWRGGELERWIDPTRGQSLPADLGRSIWIFHAQIPVHGENPFVRTIFYKIATLLQHPVLPVFVFDGPNKPGRKRNERVAGQFGTYDWRSRRFKELLDVCGLEWWNVSVSKIS
jgi:hypothetical protein